MWARRAEVADAINAGHNEAYLPELDLPTRSAPRPTPRRPLDGADIVVLAVPSQTLRDNLTQWGGHSRSALPSSRS